MKANKTVENTTDFCGKISIICRKEYLKNTYFYKCCSKENIVFQKPKK